MRGGRKIKGRAPTEREVHMEQATVRELARGGRKGRDTTKEYLDR